MNSDRVHPGGRSSGPRPTADSSTALPSDSAAFEADDSAMLGQIIDGRYRITAKLGEGGMGEVYAAEHVHIQDCVAIKLLRKEVTSNQEAVTRFRQEARSASEIGHDNIIKIKDAGELKGGDFDGRFYLCMEHLDGEPLNDILKREELHPARALDILIKSCHGLAAAHRKGIVHRDMKPENIFVTRGPDGTDVPKLLDFGIAKVSGADGDNNLTRTGTIFGTPFYMAPEQALGQGIDQRADIYAMGVIMYEMFTGSVPFEKGSFMAILTKHITATPDPPERRALERGRGLPPGVAPIIERAMQKEAGDRFQSMDEMVTELVSLHRRLVGRGMSGYMQAHLPPQSAGMPVPSYPNSPSGAVPGVTPLGVHPSGGQQSVAPITRPPVGTSPPQHYSDVYHASTSPPVDIGKKGSKAGLIAAIVIVLIVAGGTAAFVLMPDGKKAANSSNIASVENGDKTAAGQGTSNDTDSEAQPANRGGKGEAGQNQTATGNPAGVQAGGGAGVAKNTPVIPPPDAKPVVVKVTSRPRRSFVNDADGVFIGTTPVKIRVTPGTPITVTVGKKRYRNATVLLDGSEQDIRVKLEKRPKNSRREPDKSTSGPGSGSQSGTTSDQDKNEGSDKKDDKKDDKDKKTGTLNMGLE